MAWYIPFSQAAHKRCAHWLIRYPNGGGYRLLCRDYAINRELAVDAEDDDERCRECERALSEIS